VLEDPRISPLSIRQVRFCKLLLPQ
jgi:hypothetical protein